MQNNLSKLFDELKLSCERIGVERTIFQLNKTNEEGSIGVFDYIILCLCSEFKVTKNFIFTKTRRHSQKRKEALTLLAYLLYNHNDNTQKEIADLIGKDTPTINKYIKSARELSDRIPHEKALKVVLSNIENKVKELKSKPNGE